MAKGSNRNKRQQSPQQSGEPKRSPGNAKPAAPDARAIPGLHFSLGVVFLLVAVISSLMLVLDHFGGISLPGCGAGSPCAEAAASVWGSIPIGDSKWPVSFLGLAYFGGALLAWTLSRQGLSTAFVNVVRLGALISLGFAIVLATKGLACKYCLVAHAANVAYWLVAERTRRPAAATAFKPIAALAAMFVLSSGIMLAVETREKKIEDARQEGDFAESSDAIVADTMRKAAQANAKPPQATTTLTPPTEGPVEAPKTDDVANASQTDVDSTPRVRTAPRPPATEPDAIDRPWTGGFRGRYLFGPEEAAVRVVMITDYQCPDCLRIEGEVMHEVEADERVSLSIKHFPMCRDCNPNFEKHNMHPNACWAARAAETAGILYGDEGFWQMHRWLFEKKGTFTKDVLSAGLAELGFDSQEFVQTMTSQATEDLVKSDIDEAIWLGLHFTPMIFINGVELKGVFARDAGPRAIRKVLAANPPPMNHDLDQPDPGSQKCVTDWMAEPKRRLPPDTVSWASGPEDARVKIDIYADYQEPGSAQCDAAIRKWIEGRPNVRYNFRHYPVDMSCNEVASRTLFEKSCIAHRAVEAAGILGGRDAYWQMHAWVFEHQATLSLHGVVEQAEKMGFNVGMFDATMNSPAVQKAIMEDARGAKPTRDTRAMGLVLLYRGGIPTVYINGKVVRRWKLKSDVVIDEILDAALEE